MMRNPRPFSGRDSMTSGREWRSRGMLDRTRGPAREYEDGHKEWWTLGRLLRLESGDCKYHYLYPEEGQREYNT